MMRQQMRALGIGQAGEVLDGQWLTVCRVNIVLLDERHDGQ